MSSPTSRVLFSRSSCEKCKTFGVQRQNQRQLVGNDGGQHLTGISRGSLLGELPFHSSASPDRLAACAVFRQMCSLVGQEKRRILVGRLRKGSLWFGVSALVRPLGHKGETQTTHIAGTKLAPICIETAASQVPRSFWRGIQRPHHPFRAWYVSLEPPTDRTFGGTALEAQRLQPFSNDPCQPETVLVASNMAKA